MVKWFVGIMVVGWVTLIVPEWPAPPGGGSRSFVDSLILSLAYLAALGTPLVIIMLLLNRLVNVSFDIHYGKDKDHK